MQVCTLLAVLLFGTACNGQVKKDLPKEKEHPKLIKNIGSPGYGNLCFSSILTIYCSAIHHCVRCSNDSVIISQGVQLKRLFYLLFHYPFYRISNSSSLRLKMLSIHQGPLERIT